MVGVQAVFVIPGQVATLPWCVHLREALTAQVASQLSDATLLRYVTVYKTLKHYFLFPSEHVALLYEIIQLKL